MKRVLSFILVLLILGPCRAFAETPAPLLSVSAPSAVLMEKETGAVLYEKNAHDPGFPASVTKIMTLLLLFEAMDAGVLSPDDIVTASARAASFGGSCVYLEAGEQMSVREMIKCIAVVSANDCAVAMAEQLCGTEEVFVQRMNARAKELGLEHTHYSSCSGLFDDGETFTTAYDVALLSRELLRHAAVKDYTTIWMDSIRDGSFELVNTNKLVNRYPGCTGLVDDGETFTTAYDVALLSRELLRHEAVKEYTTIWMDSIRGGAFELVNTNKLVHSYPGCTGLKTGYTSTARYCLSASAEREGVEYIAVVMHAESAEARNRDAEALLNYAFAGFRLIPLRRSTPLPAVPVELGTKDSVPLAYDGPEAAVLPKGPEVSVDLRLPERCTAPIREGERLGTLRVTVGGETVAERPLVAAEAVPRIGFGGILLRLAGSLVGL